jgi:hypothetical protein
MLGSIREQFEDAPKAKGVPATMGNNSGKDILPNKPATGPGYLGPDYSPGDQLKVPGQIGVRRGGGLDDVVRAVKGVGYYTDMVAFGAESSSFTRGMGQKPLGVNYFINTGLTCSNGATMWEYVETIPTGTALGTNVKKALASSGLPPLKGMAPGIIEDAKSALNPFPVINAVIGSGYPQCTLKRLPVGDPENQIQNIDGVLIVDPSGIIVGRDGRYYQEHWIQDKTTVANNGYENEWENFMRGSDIQLAFEDWEKVPKVYRPDGCIKKPDPNKPDDKGPTDASGNLINTSALPQPLFCKTTGVTVSPMVLGDKTQVKTYKESFEDYHGNEYYITLTPKPNALVSVSVAVISVLVLLSYWNLDP